MNNAQILLNGTPDEKLEVIRQNVISQMRILLNLTPQEQIPEELSFIVDNVTVARFNRLGNEGMKTYENDGIKIQYDQTDFDPYMIFINQWLDNAQKEQNNVWKVTVF